MGGQRQVEDVAGEGRLRRDLDADRFGNGFAVSDPRALEQFVSLVGAPRQFVDYLLRQAGQEAAPVLRQQVDEQPLAGGNDVEFDLARQRDADRGAVGVAPRRADIAGGAGIEPIDRNVHPFVEVDDHDRPVESDPGRHQLVEFKDQPREAVVSRGRDLAFEQIVGAGRPERQRRRDQQ